MPPPLALTALVACLACGERAAEPPAATLAEPVTGGTAVVASPADITGINPLLDASETFSETVLDALFLQLFEEQPDFASGPASFAPELAASWSWAEDGRTLEIDLRRDVAWDDGVPVTADDVVWTWRLQTDERLGWPYGELKRSILEMEAVDAHRLRVRFANDSQSRMADLNQGHIVPRHRWAELPIDEWRDNGGWFRDNQVVSGPFRLADWRPDQQVVLERNPAYYRQGFPRLDRVVFRIVPEESNRLSQLLSGEVDFVAQVPTEAVQRVEEDPGVRLEAFPDRRYTFVHWNLARPVLAEVTARQALILAIDRQRLVDTLWFGHARVASSPIISIVWAHRDEPGPWPHDPARARRMLASLGWADEDGDGILERDGERFGFELLTNADNRTRTDAAVLIQEDLRRVGVEARVRQMEWTTMVGKLRARDFDAVVSGFSIDTSLDLTYAFHSDSIEGGLNFGSYANPEADRLIEAARSSPDLEERGDLLWRIQGILHRDQPFAFLWEPQRLCGVSRRLRGVQPNPLDSFFHLEEWWLMADR